MSDYSDGADACKPCEIKKALKRRKSLLKGSVTIANIEIFSLMAYNKKGYFIRARVIRNITEMYYEPENHAKCYKMVWQKHIYPRFGICYRTYLRYLKAEPDKQAEDCRQLKLIFE